MENQIQTAYVLADQDAPTNVSRAIEIVKLANDEQIKKILEILDSRVN